MLERTESSIKEIARDIKSSKEEGRFLEIELSAINKGIGQPATAITTPEQQLIAAEANLAQLKSKYSDNHPDVKRQKASIKKIKEELSSNKSNKNSNTGAVKNLDKQRVLTKSASVNDRLKSLQKQKKELEQKRQELEEVIIETPQVQRKLVSLNRDYENTLKKFKEIQDKEMQARLAERLEEDKKAERFSIIEPPIKPTKPIKPDRKILIAISFFAAFAIGGAIVMLLELLNLRVRGESMLTAIVRERPLVSIPYIVTEEEIKRHKKYLYLLVYISVLSIFGILVLVHLFYMPLDVLVLKVIGRLG